MQPASQIARQLASSRAYEHRITSQLAFLMSTIVEKKCVYGGQNEILVSVFPSMLMHAWSRAALYGVNGRVYRQQQLMFWRWPRAARKTTAVCTAVKEGSCCCCYCFIFRRLISVTLAQLGEGQIRVSNGSPLLYVHAAVSNLIRALGVT